MSTTPVSVAAATAQVAATLRSQYKAAVDAATAARRDQPAAARDIDTRAAALRAENARRAAAGVRVNVSPDSFDGRHIALLKSESEWHRTESKARTDLGNTLAEILLRALNLLDIAATTMHDLESRKSERDLEAARVAAAAAEVQARKDAEARGRRELAAAHASRGN